MKGFVMMRALGLTLIFTIMSPLAIFADKVVLKDGRNNSARRDMGGK